MTKGDRILRRKRRQQAKAKRRAQIISRRRTSATPRPSRGEDER